MEIFKLVPAVKDYLWGGSRLRNEFGITSDSERIAEAWMLSCHPEGRCRISGGEFDGVSLASLLSKHPEFMGTHSKNFSYFPVLIKIIDACDNLSVQVHPDDEYAREMENDQGKTELWYVVDADEDAELIYGFGEEMTQEQFRSAVLGGTILDSLEHIKVSKGDVFFIEPGTVHAIGKGVLVAEISQNENITYRIYDYDRMDSDGNPRPLHIDQAIDVAITVPAFHKPGSERLPVSKNGRFETLLGSCEYFTTRLMEISGETRFDVDETSFAHILMVEGKAKIINKDEIINVSKGDSVLVPAGYGKVTVCGDAEFIVTTI